MSGAAMIPGSPVPGRSQMPDRRPRTWAGAGFRATGRGLGFGLIALAGGALLLLLAAPMIAAGLGACCSSGTCT